MDTTQALYELQEMEADLQKSKVDLADVASRLDHNENVVRSRDRAARAKQAFAKLQLRQGELDIDVQQASTRLKELEQRLYSGKTAASKDLLALQQEIQLIQEKRGGLEEKLLEKMEQVETGQKAVATIDTELADAEAGWKTEIPKLQQEHDRLQQHAEKVAQVYDAAEALIGTADLKIYRALQKSKGTAIAKVERGLCSGCAISVPSHELQKLRTSTIPLRCSNCSRFLFASG